MNILKSKKVYTGFNSDQIKAVFANNIFKNISWLFFDKVLRMGVGLIVGVWVARYLGPTNYGLLNYALAFVTIFVAFSNLGLDNLVIEKLIKFPNEKNTILGGAFLLRLIAGLLSVFVCLISIFFLKADDTAVQIAVAITSLSCLIQAFDTIDLYFQSLVKSKFITIAKNSAFILIAIVKAIFILNNFSLIFFIWSVIFELAIGALIMIIFYRSFGGGILGLRWNRSIVLFYLKKGWPFVLSHLLVSVYMRVDQIMLGSLMDSEAVGTFSAAVKISEIWYFIPLIISSSIYPYLIKKKEEDWNLFLKKFQLVFDLASWASIIVGVFFFITGDYIIELLYGEKYDGAGQILSLHIWCGIFVFWSILGNQYLVIVNQSKISFYKTVLGAVANILLNFLLIPRMGPIGSALATLISYSIVGYFSNALFPSSRIIFQISSNSFNLVRLLRYKY